jgi:hypothetical protein
VSASSHLERRYRRLLAFYPAAFRREHEEEILSVLMEGAAEGQRWPRLAESVNLLTHAIRMRLRRAATGGVPMSAPGDNPAAKGLRGWWASPTRHGMQRLIFPWEYDHLRVFGVMRLGGGMVATGIGAFILSYGAYGWAALFLVIGALNFAAGSWLLTIARSASA